MSETVVTPTNPHDFTLITTVTDADELYGQQSPFNAGSEYRVTFSSLFENYIMPKLDATGIYSQSNHTHDVADITGLGALATFNTVGTAQIETGAITTEKLGENAVTAQEIANAAVRSEHLAQGAVTVQSIGDVEGIKALLGVDSATGGVGGGVALTGPEIAALFSSVTPQVTSAEINAATAGGVRQYSPQNIKAFIDQHAPSGGGGGGGDATDLTHATTTNTVEIRSSTGADTTLAAASTTDAGVMTADDRVKLGTITAGAQPNPDAATIKTLYESNVNTNGLTDTQVALINSVGGIENSVASLGARVAALESDPEAIFIVGETSEWATAVAYTVSSGVISVN